jgi:hypothetical protein
VASNLSFFLLFFEKDSFHRIKGVFERVGDINTFGLNGTLFSHVRFLMVFGMVLLSDELVDTLDFFAIKSKGSAIIFMNHSIELVVLSVPFSFGSSSLLCSFLSLCFGGKTSIKGGLFIFLGLLFLHAIVVITSVMVLVRFLKERAHRVDSSNNLSIGECSASIVIMEGAIELVESSLEFSFFFIFFVLHSFLHGFIFINNNWFRLGCLDFSLFLWFLSIIFVSSSTLVEF